MTLRLTALVISLAALAACTNTSGPTQSNNAAPQLADTGTDANGGLDASSDSASGGDTSTPDAQPDATPDPDVARAVEATLSAWADAQGVGLGAWVQRGDQVYASGGWGQANADDAATADTVFQVGSVTKMFTAALMHDAVERGELGWDDPVVEHLPDFALGESITLRMLAQMTAGLYDYTQSLEFLLRANQPWTHDAMRALFESRPLAFAPGTAFDYSNSNYYLLGVVLEVVTGQPFADLLASRIAAPLGLTRTTICGDTPAPSSVAQGYHLTEDGLAPADTMHMSGPFAAGAICSTPREVARFAEAFYHGRWFTPEQLAARPALPSGHHSPYTYATFAGRLNWHDTRSHGGNIPGFTASVVRIDPLDLLVVVLSNLDYADLDALVEAVAADFGVRDRAPIDDPIEPAQRAAWAGVYTAEGLPPLEVVDEGSAGLALHVQGSRFGLVRVGAADFETAPALLRLRFVDSWLEVEQHGTLLELHKSSSEP